MDSKPVIDLWMLIVTGGVPLVGALLAVGGLWFKVNRLADDVKEQSNHGERITKVESAAQTAKEALDKHYRDDMAALAKIDESVRDMRREVLAAVADLRRDIRGDTSPNRH